jgi:hypothetical protein
MEAVPSLPLLDAHQREERFRANMGSVQLHAQNAWLGLARQYAIGSVQTGLHRRPAADSPDRPGDGGFAVSVAANGCV